MNLKKLVSGILALAITSGMFFAMPQAFAEDDQSNPLLINTVVLSIGKSRAFVNGETVPIDEADSSVVPMIKNDRTLVPMRFVSESLGAQVDYESTERRVDISLDADKVSVVIGSDIMKVNGDEIKLDASAFIQSDRTFVPLRAISEAFGKKVFYDTRGIIIISDTEIDADANKDALDDLAKTFKEMQNAGWTDGIREVDTEHYFYGEADNYRDFLHGVIRPDEGTMEMTFNPVRPMSGIGNNYEFAMGVFTSKVTSGLSINIFALYAPPRPETGMIFLYKSKTSSQYLRIPEFDWEAGDKFNVACTWKAGDKMCIYKDGVLMGSVDMGDAMTEDILPAYFRVDKISPFNVRKVKFSTRAKAAEELDLNVDGDFSIDKDTSLITHDGLTGTEFYITEWQKQLGYTAISPVWIPSKQMFYEGEDVFYPLAAINHSDKPKTYTVEFGVTDNNNIAVGNSSVQITVPPDGKYHIYEAALPQIQGPNYYLVHADIYDGEEMLFDYDNAISVCNTFATIPDGNMKDIFGLQISPGADYGFMRTMNLSTIRAMNDFRWSRLEPVKGEFDFTTAEVAADYAEEMGCDVMAVLGYPPTWASLEPSAEKRAQGKKFSDLPERWQPRDKEEWANYIRTTVSHFKGRIKYWEIYNEINFIFPYSAQTFSGTKEEYYELLHIAYTEAKKADPDCVVVLSGFSAPHTGAVDTEMPMEMIDDRFKTGYFDIYNVHGYLGESSFSKEIAALKAKWPNMEYWMGEYMSFQLEGKVNRAVEFVKTMADFAAAGYSRVISMGVEGSDEVYNTLGTKSPSASYQAMAVLSAMLAKCDSAEGKVPAFAKSDVMRVDHVFKRSDGKYVSMLSAYPTEYTLTISNPDAQIYDMYGAKAETEKVGASTRVMMSDLLYIVTDEPLKVVSAVAATSDNLVLNGRFEDVTGDSALGIESLAISDWEINAEGGSTIVPSDDKKNGKYAIAVNNAGTGKTYVSQKVEAFVPTEFKVVAKFKKADPKSAAVPYVSMINNDTGKEVFRTLTGAGKGEYEDLSTVIALPMKTENGVTFCFGAKDGEGTVLIDDVQVVSVNTDDDGEQNMVANPGFEEGLGGWRLVTSADTKGLISLSGECNSGTNSIYFKSSGEGSVYAVQDITVDKPGTYRLSAYCKRTSGRNVVPHIQLYDRNANKGAAQLITNLLTYKFVRNSTTVTVENANGTQLGIIFGIKSGAGEVLMDDIKVEKID